MGKFNDDRRLIKESLKGDLFSFEIIVKRYQNQIFLYALKITKDKDLAEDITQETFIKVFKNLKSFKLNKPFPPWVYKIATNLTYDIFRKEKKIIPLDWEIEDDHESTLDKIIKKEEIKNLKNVFKKLPQKYKQPLFGFYFKGLSYKSLAQKLYLPLNTIRTRIKRGKEYLVKKLYGKRKTEKKIMHKITAEEEKRLKKLLLVAGPLVVVSFLVICFITHRTVLKMIEKEFFKVAFDFRFGKELIVSHLVECLTLFWFVIEKAILIILIVSYIILTIILLKTDFFSSPNRIKKIKKFKNETFCSPLRTINRGDKNVHNSSSPKGRKN